MINNKIFHFTRKEIALARSFKGMEFTLIADKLQRMGWKQIDVKQYHPYRIWRSPNKRCIIKEGWISDGLMPNPFIPTYIINKKKSTYVICMQRFARCTWKYEDLNKFKTKHKEIVKKLTDIHRGNIG